MRRFPLLTPVVLSFGCADMLGLEGLSYEGPVDSKDDSEEMDPAIEPHLGFGGAIEEPYEDADFPLSVEKGTVIFADPRPSLDSLYYFYDPSEKALTVHQLTASAPDEIGHQSWPTETPLSLFASFPGERDLIWGYAPESGDLSAITGADGKGALTSVENEVGTQGRTHLFPFEWDGEWLGFVYDASSGNYRYFHPQDSSAPIISGTFRQNLTSLCPFSYEGESGVLQHSASNQELSFDRFTDKQSALEPVFSVPGPAEITHIRTFIADGAWLVALYSAGTGHIEVGRLSQEEGEGEGEEVVAYHQLDTALFREALTSLTVVYASGTPYLITYSDESERAALRRLWPLDDPDAPIVVK